MNRLVHAAITTALVAVLVAGMTPAIVRAQTPPKYGDNLVINGDAEAELGAPDYNKIVTTTPGPAERGKSLFEGGNTPKSTASQTISLAPFAAAVDAGTVAYTFSAWIGGYSSQADNAIVAVVITRAEGKYNDGSVDNISLVLAKSQSPSP